MPQTINLMDLDLQSRVPQAAKVWSSSHDVFKFRCFNGKPNPLDLTDYTLGIVLVTGIRTSPTYIRPAAEGNVPSATGVSVVSATEGLVNVTLQPTDFTLDDVGKTCFLELYMTKFSDVTEATASDSGGSLAAGDYTYAVSAILSEEDVTTPGEQMTATVTTGTSGQVSVTWSEVPGVTSYNLYRKIDDGEWAYRTVEDTSYTHTAETGWTEGTYPAEDFQKVMIGQVQLQIQAN